MGWRKRDRPLLMDMGRTYRATNDEGVVLVGEVDMIAGGIATMRLHIETPTEIDVYADEFDWEVEIK